MTTITPPTLQQMLDEAIAARHSLRLGTKVVSVSYAGRTLSYSAASLGDLNAYIADLQRQIAGLQGARGRNRVSYVQPL